MKIYNDQTMNEVASAPPTIEANCARSRLLCALNILFFCAVGLVFSFAALHRFGHPLLPFLDRDIWGYLNPAVSRLSGHGFIHTGGRNFVYPGFLYVILRIFEDFRAITVAHHVLGLGAGAILLLCFERVRALIGTGLIPAWIYRWLGLGAAAIFLLSNSAMVFENRVRPESIFPFFAILNIFLTIEFVRRRFLDVENRTALYFGIALIFNTAVTCSLKPSFGVTTLIAILPVLVSLLHSRETIRRKVILIALPVILIALLLWAPEKQLARTDVNAQTFASETLFTIHANLICAQMGEDIERNNPGPYQLDWLRKTHAALQREIEASKVTAKWKTFDFDPDYLMYRPSICIQLHGEFPEHPEKLCDFYKYCYLRALTQHPGAMGRKVISQLGLFYDSPCRAYAHESLDFSEYYKHVFDPEFGGILEVMKSLKSGNEYITKMENMTEIHDAIEESGMVRRANLRLGNWYLTTLLLCLGACALVFSAKDIRKSFYGGALLVLLFFGYNFGNCIGIAVMHTLAVRRYCVVQLIFTVFAQGVGMLFLAELVAHLVRRRFNSIQYVGQGSRI